VFLGFLTSPNITPRSLFVGSLVVTVVVSIWMLYAQHYRQLYLFKIDRLLDLELEMGAEQHRRFHGVPGAVRPTHIARARSAP